MISRIITNNFIKPHQLMLSQYSLYNFGAIKKFRLPDLGEKIKEATIKKWHVQVGDAVEEFQALADVATDKMFTQIPSTDKGKVHKLLFKEDENCQVGEILLELEVDDGVDTPATTKSTSTEKSHSEGSMAHKGSRGHAKEEKHHKEEHKTLSTPAVRNLLRQENIDISQVKGTGSHGRITKEDVLKFMEGSKQKSKPSKPETPKTQTEKHGKKADAIEVPKKYSGLIHTTIKMNNFQKGMQKTMTEALTIPQFFYKDEIDLTELSKLREDVKKHYKGLTFMPFFMKAFSMALHDFPMINSHYSRENPYEVQRISNHNLSFAIDSPQGLVVPNVKNCQNLNILEINEEMNRIRIDAENSKLGMQDLQDGTFTISNIGNVGGTYLGPVILSPQTCIVAIGKAQILPRYQEGEKGSLNLVPRKIFMASFGCDHRVLDGATIAKFSNKWKSYIEDPAKLILSMR
jgi:2-oxoisovalerate dehydrogenase E2 component (dihydrolipoyl transacylase)